MDNKTLRIILGNEVAIEASRTGKTKSWPEGAILGKLVWKDAIHPKWETAIVPGKFVHAEFMFKDSIKYKETGGWGFARWIGLDHKPFGDDENFVQGCFGCHTLTKNNDWVFTIPSKLPKMR